MRERGGGGDQVSKGAQRGRTVALRPLLVWLPSAVADEAREAPGRRPLLHAALPGSSSSPGPSSRRPSSAAPRVAGRRQPGGSDGPITGRPPSPMPAPRCPFGYVRPRAAAGLVLRVGEGRGTAAIVPFGRHHRPPGTPFTCPNTRLCSTLASDPGGRKRVRLLPDGGRDHWIPRRWPSGRRPLLLALLITSAAAPAQPLRGGMSDYYTRPVPSCV